MVPEPLELPTSSSPGKTPVSVHLGPLDTVPEEPEDIDVEELEAGRAGGVSAILSSPAGSESLDGHSGSASSDAREQLTQSAVSSAVHDQQSAVVEKLSREISTLNAENAALLQSALEAEDRTSELQQQLDVFLQEREKLETAATGVVEQNTELRNQVTISRARVQELEQEIQTLKAMEEELREEIGTLRQTHAEALERVTQEAQADVAAPAVKVQAAEVEEDEEEEKEEVTAEGYQASEQRLVNEFQALQAANADLMDHNEKLTMALQTCHERLMESRRETEALRQNLKQAALEMELLERSYGMGEEKHEDDEEESDNEASHPSRAAAVSTETGEAQASVDSAPPSDSIAGGMQSPSLDKETEEAESAQALKTLILQEAITEHQTRISELQDTVDQLEGHLQTIRVEKVALEESHAKARAHWKAKTEDVVRGAHKIRERLTQLQEKYQDLERAHK